MQTVVEEGQQVVGDNALQRCVVAKSHFYPQTVQLGTIQKRFAFRSELFVQVPDKVDRPNLPYCHFLMLALGGQQIEGLRSRQPSRIQKAAQGALIF
jgi:hypothetical protein